MVAGLLLATGHFTRPAAAVLAAGLIPTTVAGHPFWTPARRTSGRRSRPTSSRTSGLLGGLLLAAADTEGRPGLRTGRRTRSDRSQRSVRRAVRTAKREAKIAAMSAAAGRKLPG